MSVLRLFPHSTSLHSSPLTMPFSFTISSPPAPRPCYHSPIQGNFPLLKSTTSLPVTSHIPHSCPLSSQFIPSPHCPPPNLSLVPLPLLSTAISFFPLSLFQLPSLVFFLANPPKLPLSRSPDLKASLLPSHR